MFSQGQPVKTSPLASLLDLFVKIYPTATSQLLRFHKTIKNLEWLLNVKKPIKYVIWNIISHFRRAP